MAGADERRALVDAVEALIAERHTMLQSHQVRHELHGILVIDALRRVEEG